MEERKKVIKNATPQDLERLSLQNLSEAIPVNEDLENNFNLKPKKSKHEPNPVKFYLPSGKIFVEEGFIWIRRLNTSEEQILLRMTNEEELLSGINKIFETAIKNDINILNIPLIDKIPIFSAIISLTYGKEFSIKDLVYKNCSGCKEHNTVKFDFFNDLKINFVPEDFQFPMSILTEDKKYYIKFRFPTIRDESTVAQGNLSFIKNIITEIKDIGNDSLVEKKDYEEIIEWFTSGDKKNITLKIKEFSKYGDEIQINVSSCSISNCPTKEKKIDVSSKEIMDIIINSIVNNLSV